MRYHLLLFVELLHFCVPVLPLNEDFVVQLLGGLLKCSLLLLVELVCLLQALGPVEPRSVLQEGVHGVVVGILVAQVAEVMIAARPAPVVGMVKVVALQPLVPPVQLLCVARVDGCRLAARQLRLREERVEPDVGRRQNNGNSTCQCQQRAPRRRPPHHPLLSTARLLACGQHASK
jgi:hypothetical protein